jgi:hypothetical protein
MASKPARSGASGHAMSSLTASARESAIRPGNGDPEQRYECDRSYIESIPVVSDNGGESHAFRSRLRKVLEACKCFIGFSHRCNAPMMVILRPSEQARELFVPFPLPPIDASEKQFVPS